MVLDFSMTGMPTGEVVLQLRKIKPKILMMMLSAYTSLPSSLTAMDDQTLAKGKGAPALLEKLGELLRERTRIPS